MQGDHPKCLAHNPWKTLPGLTEGGGGGIFAPLGPMVLTAKVGNATSKLVSRELYISYLFSLMVYIFGCQK